MDAREHILISGKNVEQGIETKLDMKKIKKPLLERKRRERINRALSHLKTLILDNIRIHGGTQTAKLDKADILEMTVNYLSLLHYGQNIASMTTDKFLYSNGYQRCSTDAMAYLTTFAHPEVTQVNTSGMFTLNQGEEDAITYSAERGTTTTSSDVRQEPLFSLIEDRECIPYVSYSTDNDSVYLPTASDNGDRQPLHHKDMSPIKCNEDRFIDNDINGEAAVWRPW